MTFDPSKSPIDGGYRLIRSDAMPMTPPLGFTKKEEVEKLEYKLKKSFENLKAAAGNEPLQASITKMISDLENRLRVAKARTDADSKFAINVLFDRPWGSRSAVPTIKRYELEAPNVKAAMEAAKKKFAEEYAPIPMGELSASNVSL